MQRQRSIPKEDGKTLPLQFTFSKIRRSLSFVISRCCCTKIQNARAQPVGVYHSTKHFEIFETGTNGTEISWEKFRKIRKLLNFRKANHLTENSGNFGMKVKWKGNFQEKIFENLGIANDVVLFFGIDANSQFSTQR